LADGKSKVLVTRIAFGTVLVLGLAGIFLADAWTGRNFATTVAQAVVVGLGCWEFYALAERKGLQPWKATASVAGGLLVVAQWLDAQAPSAPPVSIARSALLAAVLLVALLSLARKQRASALEDVSVTVFGLLYVWFLLGFYFEVRNDPALPGNTGLWIVAMGVGTSKAGDIGAFFVGRFFGRRRLAPAVSPNKTLEGSAGGLAASIVFAVAFSVLLPECGGLFGIPLAAGFGLAVGAVSQAGDLFESVLKRSVHAKDSGALIPEFGGVLDMIDGVLFSAPAVWCFVQLVK
jgi:phosphatidate cytidylyltransferase